MANYYYRGRAPYPFILLWVSIALILGIGGLFFFFVSYAVVSESRAEIVALESRIHSLQREQSGTNLEAADKAIRTYFTQKGGIGDKENLMKSLLENAQFGYEYAHLVIDMDREGKNADDIIAELSKYHIEGQSRRIVYEENMIAYYEGILSGFQDNQEVLNTMSQDPKIPNDIKRAVKAEDYEPGIGLKQKLATIEGDLGNVQTTLASLENTKRDNMEKTTQKFNEKIKIFPTLKAQYFDKMNSFDEKNAKFIEMQNEAWAGFLNKTKNMVEERRREEVTLFNLGSRLNQLSDLLTTKEAGKDWIPPLDLIDGEILSIDASMNIAIINIGRRHGLRLNQGFDVFHAKGDTLQQRKGRLEVVLLDGEMSVCKITASEQLDPMTVGDKVANGEDDKPFDRKIKPTYVLRGRFITSFPKSLIEYMIRLSNGTIDNDITKKVKYVVMGDKADAEAVALCTQLGVRIIRSRDLPAHFNLSDEEVVKLQEGRWD
ncbi:MAG: hypothetical protein HQL32_03750 [Planctomycetes bacterium]|nr:hypothetical protein [Planctomycetota bacterium]